MNEIFILKPNNDLIKIDYYKIGKYCEIECKKIVGEKKELRNVYENYKKNYTICNPYFDFLINELKYIIINPFMENNTYLKAENDKYYLMKLTSKNYNELNNNHPLHDFDFLPASDKNLCVERQILKKYKTGFMIDLDGNFYFNNYMDRHLKMARTILNQKLINSLSLNMKYEKFILENGYNKKIDFLCLKLGYMIGVSSNNKVITYNSKLINNKQLYILDKFRGNNFKIEEIRTLYKGKER